MKKGFYSSEFVVVAGVLIIGILVVSGVLTPDRMQQATNRITETTATMPALIGAVKDLADQFGGLLVLGGIAWAYLKRRTYLKAKDLQARSQGIVYDDPRDVQH